MAEGYLPFTLQTVKDGRECRVTEFCRWQGTTFLTPAKNGGDAVVMAEVVVVSDGRGSSSAATVPVWEIGQRVKQDERGEGIVLFVGTIHAVDGRLQRHLLRLSIVDSAASWLSPS